MSGNQVDWRAMFATYMETVGQEEGITFLDRVEWTADQAQALDELCAEMDATKRRDLRDEGKTQT